MSYSWRDLLLGFGRRQVVILLGGEAPQLQFTDLARSRLSTNVGVIVCYITSFLYEHRWQYFSRALTRIKNGVRCYGP